MEINRLYSMFLRMFQDKSLAPKSIPLYQGVIDYLVQYSDALPKVVQIGGHDGVSGDPVRQSIIKHRLPALVLEPEEKSFSKLVKNYTDYNNVIALNCALCESGKKKESYLYHVHPKIQKKMDRMVKRTALGVSSFSKEHVAKAVSKAFPELGREKVLDFIVSQEVVCKELGSVLEEYGFKDFDILQVDIEGYDYIVLELLDFNLHRPYVVNFEIKNMPVEKQESCKSILSSNGYRLYHHGGDVLAFRFQVPYDCAPAE